MEKNTPQRATRIKNNPTKRPAPNVISVSSEAIASSTSLLSLCLFVLRDLGCVAPHQLLESGQQVHRNREDDSRVLLHADLGQSLQVPQLNTGRLGGQQVGRVNQALRRCKLALSMDDLRALLAFGFGLLGHGARH